MPVYRVNKEFPWDGHITEKVGSVMRMFGLNRQSIDAGRVSHHCEVEINEGDIIYITGPSGSGKSVILRQLEEQLPAEETINLERVRLETDKAVVDCVEGDFLQCLRFLSTAGLNDCYCVLNRPVNLSEGEKWRYRLARALASGRKYIVADEFCTNLDRVTAAGISYKLRRFADTRGVTFLLASSHDDLLVDLEPDALVERDLAGGSSVIYKWTRT